MESTGKKIQELYFNTAKKSLKQKHKKSEKNWNKGRKKNSKKWFDNECHEMKKKMRRAGREKHKNPGECILRTRYHEKLKVFKKQCRSKRNQFWNKTLEEIENSLSDPLTFWKNGKMQMKLTVLRLNQILLEKGGIVIS